MILLLSLSSFAGGVPPRPAPVSPAEDQCSASVDLTVEGYGCRATAVPTSALADLLADRVWALQLEQHAAVCDARLQAARRKPPASLVLAGGVVGGIAAVMVAGWSLGQLR